MFEFNKRQFESYCEGIFDHRAHLDGAELEYLQHAFATVPPAIADDAPISWKTYGHKIVHGRVAAWQLGIGFETLAPDDRQSIEAILVRWLGASRMSSYRDLLAASQGAGLGWVSPQKQRRLYVLFDGSSNTPDAILDARHQRHLAEISLPEFILGYTFERSMLVEHKTYYYPHRSHWPRLLELHGPDPQRCERLAAGALRLALVVSREGESRLQFDISPRHRDEALSMLSPAGVELARRCGAIRPPLALDTVAVASGGTGLYFD